MDVFMRMSFHIVFTFYTHFTPICFVPSCMNKRDMRLKYTERRQLMQGRHEIKTRISLSDYYELLPRLNAVMQRDRNVGPNGNYKIRSLYFDTADDKALKEKLDGVKKRSKFRIRYYNDDTGFIHLEKKCKDGESGVKVQTYLSKEQAQAIIDGDYEWMRDSDNELLKEFYVKLTSEGFMPKTIVDYTREPFTFTAGNVRVTLDHDIRSGLRCTDFLDPECPTIPVPDNPIVLEIKWDNYLPDIIRDAAHVRNRRPGAFSKYAACRSYDF